MSRYTQVGHGPLAETSERQMRLREVGAAIAERVDHEHVSDTAPRVMKPHVCFSRETGAGGEEVAERVARELGWHLLDRSLLHNLAEAGAVSESLLRLVDEQRWSWFGELCAGWNRMGGINQEGYVLRMSEFLTTVAHNVPIVVVGRGAHCVLPREHGLSVRIVAPRSERIARLMQINGRSRAAASAEIDETDAARNEFVQRYFLRDATDPHWYDVVINTGRIGVDAAAELIVAECRRRFA